MTKTIILKFLIDYKQELRERSGVTKIDLFGSYAPEDTRPDYA